MPSSVTIKKLFSLVAVCCTLSACGEQKNHTEFLMAGNEAFKTGDYKQAEVEYQQALKLEPKSSTALNNLGVVQNELGKFDDAAATLERAVAADPKNAIAHYALAKSLIKKGNYTQALQEAQQSIALNQQQGSDELSGHRALAEAALLKAKSENNANDLNMAIEEYKYVIKEDPDDSESHTNLGDALAMQKNVDGALVELRKAIEIDDDNLEARKKIAELLHDRGDNVGALKEIDAVLAKNKTDNEARKMRVMLEQNRVN